MYGFRKRKADCKHCGKEFEPYTYAAEFCGTPCRMAFNNRRQKRGATLYDLIMADRFGDDPRKGRMAAMIATQLAAWRAEDKDRVSWGDVDAPRWEIPQPRAQQRSNARRGSSRRV